jgi:hypothetical protein
MCRYPRGLRAELRDEFLSELAPDRELFSEWKSVERERGHDAAFEFTRYEERFRLSAWGMTLLHELSRRPGDVFLVCQCRVGERCHREMLLLLARRLFGASVAEVFHGYSVWKKRIAELRWPLPGSALVSNERRFPE